MLVEVIGKVYQQQFRDSPHPYILEQFIEQVKSRVERVVRLMEKNEEMPNNGLIRFMEDHDCTSVLRLSFNLDY